VLWAAWHWGGDSSATNSSLKAPGTIPLYLCLPSIKGSAGGKYYFSITSEPLMEKKLNKYLSKGWTLQHGKACLALMNRVWQTTPGSWYSWQT
jgi:hypothetical protein